MKREKNQLFPTVGRLESTVELASSDSILQNYILGLKTAWSSFWKCTIKTLPRHKYFLNPQVKVNTSLNHPKGTQNCQKQLNPSKTSVYPSQMNFTLLTSHLFNSFPSLVMISTGLHNNMKMSQKLRQNGNPEAGSHEALSELRFGWQEAAPGAVSLTHLPMKDQGPFKDPGIPGLPFQCTLPFPSM